MNILVLVKILLAFSTIVINGIFMFSILDKNQMNFKLIILLNTVFVSTFLLLSAIGLI